MSMQCARCGKFTITRTAARVAEGDATLPSLSAWIRERTEMGVEVPEVNSTSLCEIQANLPTYRVPEKLLILLRSLERKTTFPGQEILIVPNHDFPLAWAASEIEFRFLFHGLIERELVRNTEGSYNDGVFKCQITPGGWEYLDRHAQTSVISNQAFVAMSFAEEMTPAWEVGIRPGVQKAGFDPYRVDVRPHIDRIDNKIITEIRNSRFLVADVTLQRPGVYFEAGFALGLGLPVFWCVRKDDLPNVHFDTRQYNHIVWEQPEELVDRLSLFISAIVVTTKKA